VVPVSALRGPDSSSDSSPGGGPDSGLQNTANGGASSGLATGTVWLEKSGRVEARSVRLGLRTLESVEVLQGLAAGDVVLSGPSPVPGQRVKADRSAPLRPNGKAKSDDAGSALGNAMGR
jgi:HlyD family secretion protein